MKKLYHITNWAEIPRNVGDTFTLRPGTQCAEGSGVYFSDGEPRPDTADGTYMGTCAAVIEIAAQGNEGWWKTKNSICRKHNRPRTFHSRAKKIKCLITEKTGWGQLKCSWEWA